MKETTLCGQRPRGNITTLTYYPTGVLGAGQIQTIKDAHLKVTTYTYDARGNRLTIQDPVNASTKLTTLGYDSMNRPDVDHLSGGHDQRMTGAARRDWVEDQNGFKTTHGYDVV
jgi:YD repeat-containing protein